MHFKMKAYWILSISTSIWIIMWFLVLSWLMWCIHLLISVCSIIFAFLERSLLGHSEQTFECILEFGLQIFYREFFLHLCLPGRLSYKFVCCVLVKFWYNTNFIKWVYQFSSPFWVVWGALVLIFLRDWKKFALNFFELVSSLNWETFYYCFYFVAC